MVVASVRFRAFLLVAFSCAALITNGEPVAPAKVYRDVLRQQDVMVAARDGVLLATDIYRPATGGVAAPERLPVLLHRTPYDKSEAATVAIAETLAKHGYVVMLQDTRGRHHSQGVAEILDHRVQLFLPEFSLLIRFKFACGIRCRAEARRYETSEATRPRVDTPLAFDLRLRVRFFFARCALPALFFEIR